MRLLLCAYRTPLSRARAIPHPCAPNLALRCLAAEWELVRRATPRFPGHLQPHVPLWGEIDTGLPETWSFLNAQALNAGISVYLWDFYCAFRESPLKGAQGAP